MGKLDAPSSTKASKNFLAHNATANIFFREEGKFKSGSKLDSMLASPQAIVEEKTGMQLGYKKRANHPMNQSMTIDAGKSPTLKRDFTLNACKALLQED